METLIGKLYTPLECKAIRNIFSDESYEIKNLILNAIGNKIIIDKHNILLTNSIDTLFLACLTSTFASSREECYAVAIAIHQYFNKPEQILPLASEDFGLKFATKTLISLSFYLKALEYRWKHKGAPSPAFYRNISKTIFASYGHADIATHHEQWEIFLGEIFV